MTADPGSLRPAGLVAGAAARGWLTLALVSLLVAGGFAALLVVLRAPALAGLGLPASLFPAALALHVNLAFVVWLLTMAATFFAVHRRRVRPRIDRLAVALGGLGAVAMVASAFIGGGRAVMNNYLPVLATPLFGAGLAALLAGVSVAAACLLAESPRGRDPERLAAWLGAAATLVAIGAIGASLCLAPADLAEQAYYEAVFWAGGHLLQLTHSLLLLAAWLALARGAGFANAPDRAVSVLLCVAALPVLAGPIGFGFAVESPEHRAWFTSLMRWGTWPAVPGLLALLGAASRGAVRPLDPEARGLRACLWLSAGLFGLGLLFGAFIRGDGLLVTAHYHGTVGAVTLAYMGWSRVLCRRLGLAAPSLRLARLQTWLYGAGLLALVLALAVAGGAGLPRKTPAALLPGATPEQRVSLAVVAGGGLVAVAGLVVFLGSTLIAVRRPIGQGR